MFVIEALSKKINPSAQTYVGTPVSEMLLEGLQIIDYKLERTKEAFGELVTHLHNLHANIRRYCDHLFIVKGALACRDGIWLVRAEKTTVHDVEIVSWTANGGQARLIDFLVEQSPVAEVVEIFLKELDVELYERDTTPSSFLGMGGCGSVFTVLPLQTVAPQVRNALAMKVVVGPAKTALLRAEYYMNEKVSKSGGQKVIVTALTLKSRMEGAGMLMSEVGSPIEATGVHERAQALKALCELHKAGFYHGDARKENLVQVGDAYKWVDLQRAGELGCLAGEQSLKFLENDINLLILSCGGQEGQAHEELRKYSKNLSESSLHEFVLAISPNFLMA